MFRYNRTGKSVSLVFSLEKIEKGEKKERRGRGRENDDVKERCVVYLFSDDGNANYLSKRMYTSKISWHSYAITKDYLYEMLYLGTLYMADISSFYFSFLIFFKF